MLLLSLAGCEGEIVGPGTGTGSNTDPLCALPNPGPAPIRRMTRTEYNNTVRDLLGDTTKPADAFPKDETALGFDNNASALSVSSLLAEQYMDASESLAKTATANLSTLLPCDPAAGEDACARQFIQTFGKRAWRRPVTSAEVDSLDAVYTAGRMGNDVATGIQLVIEAMLQSPHFLYRVEFGSGSPIPGTTSVPLSDYEMASRLSYFLWNSMPDDQLFAAADAGQLHTKEQIAAQASRMIDDPKAHDAVANFNSQWLQLYKVDDLDKDAIIFPAWNAGLRPLLKQETSTFADAITFGGGTMEDLLTAPYTYVNQTLATYYGLTGASGDTFQKVSVDPSQRSGVLTQGSILALTSHADQTSPVRRGKFIQEQLLCQSPPPPPPNLNIKPPAVDPNSTTRQRFTQHTSDPFCAGCHHWMDPIGFGFENFDAIGKFRTTEDGMPIDNSGEMTFSDVDGPFMGVTQLAQKLTTSAKVQDCVVTQWFRFGYGRAETMDDACSLKSMKAKFTASNHRLKDLIVAVTQTDAFLYRPVVQP
jgi:hypothetical protein